MLRSRELLSYSDVRSDACEFCLEKSTCVIVRNVDGRSLVDAHLYNFVLESEVR